MFANEISKIKGKKEKGKTVTIPLLFLPRAQYEQIGYKGLPLE